jgi:hypothetical protein
MKKFAEGGEVARPAYRPRTPVSAAARAEQDKVANFSGQAQQAQGSTGSGLMGGAALQGGTSTRTTPDKEKRGGKVQKKADGGGVKPISLDPQVHLDALKKAQQQAGGNPSNMGTTSIKIGGQSATSKGK